MTKRLTPEEKALNKAQKAKTKVEKPSKPPKASTEKPKPPKLVGDAVPGAASTGLELIKTKLRRKFHLLAHDPLNFDSTDALKGHVCKILGMELPSLNSILADL